MLATTNTRNRKEIFADPACAREAIESLYRIQEHHPFFLYGFVIMPDHCYFLMQIPWPGSISRIIHLYKIGVAFHLGRGSIWQPRFHIRIPKKPGVALNYIHQNPVKAGLVQSADMYPWSSAPGKWDVMEFESF
ncbi:transposase [Candidatus Peregrinibacteria bacterium]|nr:transposase [Candidatus Peregrinibacteria bacterium]